MNPLRLAKIIAVSIIAVLIVTFAKTSTRSFSPHTGEMIIKGAGATFPYPLYLKWIREYERIRPVRIDYQSVGSGGGIRLLMSGSVDFAGSDAPLNDEEMSKILEAGRGVVHVPTVAGAVVIVFNLPGARELNLTPDTIAKIFLGKIKYWDNPSITKYNDINLPHEEIRTVHRVDGSGTTYIFTYYLSKISDEWRTKIGYGKEVDWPTGLGGKGNEGVSQLIQQIPYSIGYTEYTYAITAGLSMASVMNRAGIFITPSVESISKAAVGYLEELKEDIRSAIVNSPEEDAYPISSYTYIITYQDWSQDPEKGKALAEFLWWATHDGQMFAPDLGYAPLHPEVVKIVESIISEMKANGSPLLGGARQ